MAGALLPVYGRCWGCREVQQQEASCQHFCTNRAAAFCWRSPWKNSTDLSERRRERQMGALLKSNPLASWVNGKCFRYLLLCQLETCPKHFWSYLQPVSPRLFWALVQASWKSGNCALLQGFLFQDYAPKYAQCLRWSPSAGTCSEMVSCTKETLTGVRLISLNYECTGRYFMPFCRFLYAYGYEEPITSIRSSAVQIQNWKPLSKTNDPG